MSPHELSLNDSQFIDGVLSENAKSNAFYISAVDKLLESEMDIYSFSGSPVSKKDIHEIVSYRSEKVGRF